MTRRRSSLWKRRRQGQVESLEARFALSTCDEQLRWYEGSTAEPTPIPMEVREYQESVGALSGDSWQPAVPTGALHPLTDLPALSSLPGAAATLYLDFNGHVDAQWGYDTNVVTPTFDQDGDPTTFSDGELAAIEGITRGVAEDYAPFNINVTTVVPVSFANGASLRVAIGGDGNWVGGSYGGIAYVDSFTNSIVNTVYVFAKNLANGHPKFTADAVSHEAGHGFGLDHQAKFDLGGNLLAEYSPGPGDGRAPLMGSSYSAPRSLWWLGNPPTSADQVQDDIAIIARPANGFGLRGDDFGNTTGTAAPLVLNGVNFSVEGVIGSTSDVDLFSFHAGEGLATFTVRTQGALANLDARLELRDAMNQTVLATSDPSGSFDATISLNLAAGNYLLVVGSHGGYGDVGYYSLSGTLPATSTTVPQDPGPQDPGPQDPEPQPDIFDGPTDLVATPMAFNRVNLEWTDNANCEDGVVVERSANRGLTWIRVATLPADTTTYSAVGLVANTTYSFRVVAMRGTERSTSSEMVLAKTLPMPTRPVAPDQLRVLGATGSTVTLGWRDRSNNELGFRVERSINRGRTWETVGTVDAGQTVFIDSAVLPLKIYNYRVRAFNEVGSSTTSLGVVARTTALTTAGAPVAASRGAARSSPAATVTNAAQATERAGLSLVNSVSLPSTLTSTATPAAGELSAKTAAWAADWLFAQGNRWF